MDRRKRNYYQVHFDYQSSDMRKRYLVIASPSIKFHYRENGLMISCLKDDAEAVEYELRKAERNDNFCQWMVI